MKIKNLNHIAYQHANEITKFIPSLAKKKTDKVDKKLDKKLENEKPKQKQTISNFQNEKEVIKKITDKINNPTSEDEKKQEQESQLETEDEQIFSDNFRVRSDGINCLELVSAIQLPKFKFIPSYRKQSSAQGMKGNLIMQVLGGIDKKSNINTYLDLLKVSRDGLKNFEVDLLGEEDEVLMTLVLNEPRIHAIDLGTLELEREAVRSITIEIDFESISINGELL